MKKNVGLWIDHREAVMVFASPEGEVIKKISSAAEKHAGRIDGERSTAPYESQLVHADDSQQRALTGHLNHYYDEVIADIHDAESILIFGPGEAKTELKNRMQLSKANCSAVIVEAADKMTDPQIAAKVWDYFKI